MHESEILSGMKKQKYHLQTKFRPIPKWPCEDVQQMQAEREKNEEELIYVQDQTQSKCGGPVQEYHLAVLEWGDWFYQRFVAQWLVHWYTSYTSQACVIRIKNISNTIVSNPLSMVDSWWRSVTGQHQMKFSSCQLQEGMERLVAISWQL